MPPRKRSRYRAPELTETVYTAPLIDFSSIADSSSRSTDITCAGPPSPRANPLAPSVTSPKKRKSAAVHVNSIEYSAPQGVQPESDAPASVAGASSAHRTTGRARGVGTSHGKTTTEYNKEFEAVQAQLLEGMMSLEWNELVGSMCDCAEHGQRLYRCLDCFGSTVHCHACFHQRHGSLPLHAIEKWNGTAFEPAALGDHPEFRVHLGHHGAACPTTSAEVHARELNLTHYTHEMTVVHLNGRHTLTFVLCRCRGPRQELPSLVHQLVRARIFPSTFSRPTIGYTFELMAHWHLESLQSKKSTWDYWQAVCQKNKRGQERKGYHGFLRAGHFWRVLKMQLRSGQAHGIDAHLPANRWPRSVIVACPACPEPEFNLQPNWNNLVNDEKHRFKFILWHGTDASFKVYLKVKLRDAGDTSLLDGRAFLPTRSDWEAYTTKNSNISQEAGSCPGYDKMHKIQDIGDREVSGLSAVCCIRHSSFPAMGMVDLKLGEKYYMIDHGWVYAQGPKPDTNLPRALSSDRACSLCINIMRRLRAEFPDRDDVQQIARELVWVIPKMHIQGHCEKCQYLFHLLYTPGAGRACGEGVERPWAETKLAAAICRDANAGHRQDILNDVHNFWNFNKVVGLGKYLYTKAEEAHKHVAVAEAEFQEFASSIARDRLAAWEEEYPTEKAVVEEDTIRGRYCVDPANRPNHKDIIARLEAEERLPGQARKRGVVGMMAKGVQLAEDQVRLRRKAENAKKNKQDKDAQQSLRQKRRHLSERISSFRRLQLRYMPGIAEAIMEGEMASGEADDDDGLEETSYAEDIPLMLPSWFSEQERKENGVPERLVHMETELRKAHAEGALSNLRFSIRLFGSNADEARDQVDNTSGKTRARAYLKKMKSKQTVFVNIYSEHLGALRALGLSRDDSTYQNLDTTMLRAHPPADKPQPLSVGKSKGDVAWFWRGELDVSLISKQEKAKLALLTDDDNRVRYFRLQGHYRRWSEQMAIVGAEFGRSERHFSKMVSIWKTIGGEQRAKAMAGQLTADAAAAGYGPDVLPWQRLPADELRSWHDAEGAAAYAFQKVGFYSTLLQEIRDLRARACAQFKVAEDWNQFDADLYTVDSVTSV